MKLSYYLFISLFFLFQYTKAQEFAYNYEPKDIQLYHTIVAMDSVFFEAYNNCNMEKQAAVYSDSIEFFHDIGGLSTSKKEILASTKNNICGKVTRAVIPGSIEVYPIKNYGAVEMGYHKFFNSQEPNAESIPMRFIIIWKTENDNWKITKVISLH